MSKGRIIGTSNYEIARLASPSLSLRILKRHLALHETLVPRIAERVASSFGGATGIEFVSLVGSSTSFRSYHDLDIKVGLKIVNGILNFPVIEEFPVVISDEDGAEKEKTADVYFYDSSNIDDYRYFRFFYRTPTLIGEIPSLYSDKRATMIGHFVGKAIEKYVEEKDVRHDPRKAMHRLFAACRQFYNLCEVKEQPLPLDFVATIKKLYSMDDNDAYDIRILDEIASKTVTRWIAGLS